MNLNFLDLLVLFCCFMQVVILLILLKDFYYLKKFLKESKEMKWKYYEILSFLTKDHCNLENGRFEIRSKEVTLISKDKNQFIVVGKNDSILENKNSFNRALLKEFLNELKDLYKKSEKIEKSIFAYVNIKIEKEELRKKISLMEKIKI